MLFNYKKYTYSYKKTLLSRF